MAFATAEPSNTTGGYTPRVWVGSLFDYNNGRLYGVWMDATLEPEELHAAVQFMLRNSDTPGAEEWSIFDHDDFCGYEISEWSSFQSFSQVPHTITVRFASQADKELCVDEAASVGNGRADRADLAPESGS